MLVDAVHPCEPHHSKLLVNGPMLLSAKPTTQRIDISAAAGGADVSRPYLTNEGVWLGIHGQMEKKQHTVKQAGKIRRQEEDSLRP